MAVQITMVADCDFFFRRTSYINNILNASSTSASSSSCPTTASGGGGSTNTTTNSPSRTSPAPGISTYASNSVNNNNYNNNNNDNERNDNSKSKTSVLAKEDKKMQGCVKFSFLFLGGFPPIMTSSNIFSNDSLDTHFC